MRRQKSKEVARARLAPTPSAGYPPVAGYAGLHHELEAGGLVGNRDREQTQFRGFQTSSQRQAGALPFLTKLGRGEATLKTL